MRSEPVPVHSEEFNTSACEDLRMSDRFVVQSDAESQVHQPVFSAAQFYEPRVSG